jgi:hypothetical protein
MRSICRRACSARRACVSRASRASPAAIASPPAPRQAAAWGAARGAAAASALLLVAACGSAAPGSGKPPAPGRTAAATSPGPATTAGTGRAAAAATAQRSGKQPPGQPGQPGQQPCDPRQIGPIAASFVSAADGYLLGITLSDCAASASSKIALRETADGGLHWTALPAPPAPWGGAAPDGTGHIPADGVTSLLFADARDGWAYGPGLWATHDGGATWRLVATRGRAVQSMAVTGGQVIASLESCDPVDASCDGPQAWTVESTPAGRDAWRPVPGATGDGTAVLSAQAGAGFAVSPRFGQPGSDVSMLTGPADGSARWVSRPLPCQPGAIALTAVTTTRLLLACALLGAHPATTYLYSSTDPGAHWTRFAVLGLFDGADAIEQTPDGTVLVAGIYDGVELSRDGGRTWTKPATVDDSLSVQGGGPLAADLVTSEEGYAIGWLGPLWITRDAGRTWTQVPVR